MNLRDVLAILRSTAGIAVIALAIIMGVVAAAGSITYVSLTDEAECVVDKARSYADGDDIPEECTAYASIASSGVFGFDFRDVAGAPVNTRISSAPILIDNFDGEKVLSISGPGSPLISVNGGDEVSGPVNVKENDEIIISLISDPLNDTARTATAVLDGISETWTVLTGSASAPAPVASTINFDDSGLQGVEPSSVNDTPSVTVSGFSGLRAISVSGEGDPYLIINGGTPVKSGFVQDGDDVVVRHAAHGDLSTSSNPMVHTVLVSYDGGTATVTSTTREIDSLADNFAFSPDELFDRNPGAQYISESVTISGFDQTLPVAVSGAPTAQLEVNGSGSWVTSATIMPGDQVRIRFDADPAFLGQETATLTVGSGGTAISDAITQHTRDADRIPNAFNFSPSIITSFPTSSVGTSDAVTLTGFEAALPIVLSGDPSAEYRINGGPWLTAPGTVNSGDTVEVRVTSAPGLGQARTGTVTIGDAPDTESASFTVSTAAADGDPDAFTVSFGSTDINNLDPNEIIISDPISMTGFNTTISVCVDNGGGVSTSPTGPFTNCVNIDPGDDIYVQVQASSLFNTTSPFTLSAGGTSDNFAIKTRIQDVAPNSFDFVDQSNVEPATQFFSNNVTLSGFDGPLTVSLSGDPSLEMSINSGAYVTSGAVSPGDTMTLRMTSAPGFTTATTGTVTIGTFADDWVLTTRDEDTSPAAFDFTDQSGVEPGATILSNNVTLSLFDGPQPIVISGHPSHEISINGGPFGTSGSVSEGDDVQLRLVSSALGLTSLSGTLQIGSTTDSWSVTTRALDTAPDGFDFSDFSDVEPSASIPSSIENITGFDGPLAVSISGDASFEFSINGGPFGTSGSINPGDTLQVRIASDSAFGAVVSGTITIGSTSDTFAVTTRAQDITPDSFDFLDQSDVALDSDIVSNAIIISGFDGPLSVTLSGDPSQRLSINSGSFTSSGTVNDGDQVELRLTSSSSATTAVAGTIDIGTFSDTWQVTTAAIIDNDPDFFDFEDQTSVPLSSTVNSNIVTITGIADPVAVLVSGDPSAEFSINGGPFTTSGTVAEGDTLQIRVVSSANNSEATNLTIDVGEGTDVWTIITEPLLDNDPVIGDDPTSCQVLYPPAGLDAVITASGDLEMFGYTADTNGERIVTAFHDHLTRQNDGTYVQGGGAVIWNWDGTSWQEEAVLGADFVSGGARASVSINTSGEYAIMAYGRLPFGQSGSYGDMHDASTYEYKIFRRSGSSWEEHQSINVPDHRNLYHQDVGPRIAMGEDWLFISRAFDREIDIFHKVAAQWTLVQTLPNVSAGTAFGVEVAPDDSFAMISDISARSVSLYTYNQTAGNWELGSSLTSQGSVSPDSQSLYGNAMDTDGVTIIIGDPRFDDAADGTLQGGDNGLYPFEENGRAEIWRYNGDGTATFVDVITIINTEAASPFHRREHAGNFISVAGDKILSGQMFEEGVCAADTPDHPIKECLQLHFYDASGVFDASIVDGDDGFTGTYHDAQYGESPMRPTMRGGTLVIPDPSGRGPGSETAYGYIQACQATPAVPLDQTPDPIVFDLVQDATENTEYISNEVTVAGFDGPVIMRITGPDSAEHYLSVNSGMWVKSAPISPGDAVRLRTLSPSMSSTEGRVYYEAGDYAASWYLKTGNNANFGSLPSNPTCEILYDPNGDEGEMFGFAADLVYGRIASVSKQHYQEDGLGNFEAGGNLVIWRNEGGTWIEELVAEDSGYFGDVAISAREEFIAVLYGDIDEAVIGNGPYTTEDEIKDNSDYYIHLLRRQSSGNWVLFQVIPVSAAVADVEINAEILDIGLDAFREFLAIKEGSSINIYRLNKPFGSDGSEMEYLTTLPANNASTLKMGYAGDIDPASNFAYTREVFVSGEGVVPTVQLYELKENEMEYMLMSEEVRPQSISGDGNHSLGFGLDFKLGSLALGDPLYDHPQDGTGQGGLDGGSIYEENGIVETFSFTYNGGTSRYDVSRDAIIDPLHIETIAPFHLHDHFGSLFSIEKQGYGNTSNIGLFFADGSNSIFGQFDNDATCLADPDKTYSECLSLHIYTLGIEDPKYAHTLTDGEDGYKAPHHRSDFGELPMQLRYANAVLTIPDYQARGPGGERNMGHVQACFIDERPFKFTDVHTDGEGDGSIDIVESNEILLTAMETITGTVPITITSATGFGDYSSNERNAEFSINDGPWITSGTIAPGDLVKLRAEEPSGNGLDGATYVLVKIGEQHEKWSITTDASGINICFNCSFVFNGGFT